MKSKRMPRENRWRRAMMGDLEGVLVVEKVRCWLLTRRNACAEGFVSSAPGGLETENSAVGNALLSAR